MTFRPLVTDDAPALAEMRARAFRTPWSVQAFAELLDAPEVFGLIADGGFALARAAAGEAELLLVAVEPNARRRGLGRFLLRAVLEAAAARGAGGMFLEVAADNAAALALYAGEGFARVGVRRGYYARPGAAPVDALVMRRALNSARA